MSRDAGARRMGRRDAGATRGACSVRRVVREPLVLRATGMIRVGTPFSPAPPARSPLGDLVVPLAELRRWPELRQGPELRPAGAGQEPVVRRRRASRTFAGSVVRQKGGSELSRNPL
ncbi:hypothetical protein GCM10027161_65810 [Microbispora hainanensis]